MKIVLLQLCLIILFSCGNGSITKTKSNFELKGKWYIDKNWYEFKTDSTYAAGVAEIKFFDSLKYFHNQETQQLTMYTNTEDQTFYYNYTVPHIDTIILKSVISPEAGSLRMIRKNKNGQ